MKASLEFKLNEYINAGITYPELQEWLDSGEASKAVETLSSRERQYYSWMRQRLDLGKERYTDKELTAEVAFFIRIMRGQVSWLERWLRWWSFR